MEQLRAGAIRDIQQATAMREQAAQTRLQIWLERLTQLKGNTCPHTSFEQALDAAVSVASADCANIQLIHASGRGLVLKAQRGFGQSFLDFFEFVDDDYTACGLALKERRSVVVHDIISSPIFGHTRGLEVMLEAGIRAVKSTPLVGPSGQVLGMLSVHYHRPNAHIDSDLVRLQVLARVVGTLIDGRTDSPYQLLPQALRPVIRQIVDVRANGCA
jgi:GAF domain-containing protein